MRITEVVGIRRRLSEPPEYGLGVDSLAGALSARAGCDLRFVGEASLDAHKEHFAADLQRVRPILQETRADLTDRLGAEGRPVLVHGDCALAIGTLPAVAARRPDARVLWLDAHGDFNTPETGGTWLGGMALAGGCGMFETGVGGETMPPERVVHVGARDLDPGERELLERTPVRRIAGDAGAAEAVLAALGDAPVYIHLDPDVLDPAFFPAEFPADGGMTPEQLRDLLAAVAQRRTVVGLEVCAFFAPLDSEERQAAAELLADVAEPLLAERTT